MNVVILVASHKEYRMPTESIYLPVQAGAAIHDSLSYIGDNSGDSISAKNPYYCELTVLYWGWKNIIADYLGLVQYRRHFSGRSNGDKWSSIIKEKELIELLNEAPIIVPKKRNYFIETNYSQYAHAHHEKDLLLTREIIAKHYKEYLDSFDRCMERRTGHRFNMFIMKKEIMDAYCSWLFDILFRLETRIDVNEYSEYDKRVFGFIAERILDVWLETNSYRYVECPTLFMESQNWLKKGTSFIKRKMIH